MNKNELKELLEKLGVDAMLCDTPVPYFRDGVPAGYPEAPGDYDGEFVLMPKSFLKMCDFILSVHGDSMKGVEIEDGDDVIVKADDRFDDGDIVVAFLDGETTLKTYYKEENGDVWLLPANDSYPPIRVSDYTTTYILGRVTSVRKKSVRMSYHDIHRRLREVKECQRKTLTDEMVRESVMQVLPDIKVGRMWFCVYRVLADAGYIHKENYEEMKERMDALFPENDFNINPKDLSRMDVLSFRREYALWNEERAPVTGKRFREYLNLAADLSALLNDCQERR